MASFACWLAQLKAKGPREADFTRALIREKLADQDQEIATTSCKVGSGGTMVLETLTCAGDPGLSAGQD